MAILHVTTLSGEKKQLEAATGTVLMTLLQDNGLVEGTCGGAASCGTCHVYFESKDVAGTQTEDEGYMLEGLEAFVDIREGSRLSCQVTIAESHNGLHIEIAPEA